MGQAQVQRNKTLARYRARYRMMKSLFGDRVRKRIFQSRDMRER